MKVLELFAGIGGFSLGLERAGMKTVAFCEFDKNAQKVLRKHWPKVPIHSDIKDLHGEEYKGTVDVITGGFPCQDLSSAGKKAGFEGERSSLYTEMLRVVSTVRPKYVIFENVSALKSGDKGRWFAKFLYDVAQIGYDAEWHCISASSVGAPHQRDRIWVVAYPHEAQLERGGLSKRISEKHAQFSNTCWGKDKPGVVRTSDGIPNRAHRLNQLGNAVVPLIPFIIGTAILEMETIYAKD